jgi:ribosomal protein L6P/L9E
VELVIELQIRQKLDLALGYSHNIVLEVPEVLETISEKGKTQ